MLFERSPLPLSIENLPAVERDALEEFRGAVGVPVDTVTALWFLRARKEKKIFNVAKAAKMYMAHLEWRKSYGADELMHAAPKAAPEVLAAMNDAFAPKLLDFVDLKGRPVMYMSYGKLDAKALADKGVTQDLLMRRYVHEMERLRVAISAADDPLAGRLPHLACVFLLLCACLAPRLDPPCPAPCCTAHPVTDLQVTPTPAPFRPEPPLSQPTPPRFHDCTACALRPFANRGCIWHGCV